VPADFDRFRQVLKAELTEIITNYDPAILWFDGEWEDTWTTEMGRDIYWHVRDLKPDIITNNRLGKVRYLGGASAGKDSVGDYGTPEQEIPAGGLPGADWESCMTMNDTWGYSRHDTNWKSSSTLIRNLVNCASKGGNYLLNVGPTAEGYIPAESIDRLNEVGRWMDVNSESIYGTSASPFTKPLPWGAVTRKPGKLYLHVWSPESAHIVLPGLKNKTGQAFLLSDPARKIEVARIAEGLRLTLPDPLPDNSATVIVLPIEGEPKVAPVPPIRSESDGSYVLNALDAATDSPARYEEDKRAIGYWTDAKATVSWTVELKTQGTYEVFIEQAVQPDTEGAEYSVEIDRASVKGRTMATDNWHDFRTVSLGTLRVDRAGRHLVIVRPTTMPGFAVMNLRSVRLMPVR
jgi:alpha-L-fucosidase